ncbi:MAG: HAD hydrolase family protein [Clostridia bacterium]|nr:HAD hydrolase family protein [Clostridia bacterium]
MRLIASDYDGTFNNHGGVDDARRRAVADWQAAGNKFGIVSGRSIDFLPPTLERDGVFCDYFIANNGAVITDGNGKVLIERRCDGAVALPLIRTLFELSCPHASVTTDRPCTVYPALSEVKTGQFTVDDAEIPYFNQISTVLPTFEEAERVTSIIWERFGKWVNPLQNGICIDIVPAGVDKAEGIRSLLALWEMEESNVIAVGDNVNDAAMIAAFPSYAVDNAVEAIKALAGRVIPTVTDLIRSELF